MFLRVCTKCWGRVQPIRSLLNDCRSRSPMISIKEAREELRGVVGTAKSWEGGKTKTQGGGRDESVYKMKLAASQSELPKRSMQDSYREVTIPLGSNVNLREKYVNFWNVVRIGRILEDLDTMAVLISYSHCCRENEKSPLSVVTGMVDRIDLDQNKAICQDKDIILRGHVTWVGSSSLEVSMQLKQDQEGTGVPDKILEAHFLMVARDPHNKTKAFVNPLEVTTPEEQKIIDEGEKSRVMREQERNESLLKHPPGEEERLLIHQMFLDTLDPSASTFKARVKPSNAVWIEDTLLKNVVICFPEQRNLYNKIFGGYLMRQAFELAWANATLYSKTRVHTIAMDDIMFQKPVEVGSLLFLSTEVIYTQGPYLQLKVHAEVVDPKTGSHQTTNVFHYTFSTRADDVPVVKPKSYAEFMMYLDGKRHFQSGKTAQSMKQAP